MNIEDIIGKKVPSSGDPKRRRMPKGVMGGSVGFVSIPSWIMDGASGAMLACVAGKLTYEETAFVLGTTADEIESKMREMIQKGLEYYEHCKETGTNFEQDFKANAKGALVTKNELHQFRKDFDDLMDKDPD